MHIGFMALSDPHNAALQYVRYVLQRKRISPSALADKAGLSSTTLTRPLNDPNHKFALTTTSLDKIRDWSGIDYAPFLSSDMDTVARSIHMLEHADYDYPAPSPEDRPPAGIVVMGEVAAGVWREEQFLSDTSLGMVGLQSVNPDLRKHMIGLVVKGESLNKLARENDILVVESLRDTGTVPRDGDLVVVERKRGQEGIFEMTAKRLRRRGSGLELWPESTDQRYQEPLRILDDRRSDEATIVGLVHYIVRIPLER